MLDKFNKYAPAISPLTVAAPAGEGRTATSREVAGRKRYLRRSCGWLVAVAVLAISPIAHSDPVHMACSGWNAAPKQEGGHELCPVAHNRFARRDGDSRGLPTGGNPPSIPSTARVRDSGFGKQRGVLHWVDPGGIEWQRR